MAQKNCPICGEKRFRYDVVEAATGWTFCGDCYTQTIKEFRKMDPQNFASLLRAIATTRENEFPKRLGQKS